MAPSRRTIRNYFKNHEKNKAKENIVEEKSEINEQSTMSEERFNEVCRPRKFTHRHDFEKRCPHECPEDCTADRVVLCEYPFKKGLRLPFSAIVIEILQAFQISSGQIMHQELS